MPAGLIGAACRDVGFFVITGHGVPLAQIVRLVGAMSTPTVAGITASFVAITEPTMLPLPRCASGIKATCLNKQGRRETLRSIDSVGSGASA